MILTILHRTGIIPVTVPISWHEKYKMAYTSPPNFTPKWGSMYTMKIIVYIVYLVNNEVKKLEKECFTEIINSSFIFKNEAKLTTNVCST